MRNKIKKTSIILVLIFMCTIFNNNYFVVKATNPQSFENQMNELAKETFNSQFKDYEGEITAATAKSLCSRVELSNSTQTDHKVQIEGVKEFESSKTYIVTLNYGEDGYINIIQINKKTEEGSAEKINIIATNSESTTNNNSNNSESNKEQMPNTGKETELLIIVPIIICIIIGSVIFVKLKELKELK